MLHLWVFPGISSHLETLGPLRGEQDPPDQQTGGIEIGSPGTCLCCYDDDDDDDEALHLEPPVLHGPAFV